jgi:hypothetical protein
LHHQARKTKIQLSQPGSSWTFGKGGNRLPDHQWVITLTRPDATAEIYPLPYYLCRMIERIVERTREELQGEIRNILGLNS